MLSGTMDRGIVDYELEAAVGKIMASVSYAVLFLMKISYYNISNI